MCDSCPECPECGQDLAEPATPRYMAGLLLPPGLAILLSYMALEHGMLPTGPASLMLGWFMCGGMMLVSSDQHVHAWLENRVQG